MARSPEENQVAKGVRWIDWNFKKMEFGNLQHFVISGHPDPVEVKAVCKKNQIQLQSAMSFGGFVLNY
jgi:hypothetical protein